jgi:sigma-B regulation protein RsbU (phosphoserine phosphatase)
MLNLSGDPQATMREVVEMMREMSRHSEPQAMVSAYRVRARALNLTDGSVSVSRRDLVYPWYRVTRSTRWVDDVNPWRDRDKLPLLDRGLLGELLYSDEPKVINDFRPDPADPAYEHMKGYRSALAIPNYDQGKALNMTLLFKNEPNGFDPAVAPMQVWIGNLFGRATNQLVLADELRKAYEAVDRELRAVSEIQRSLLPVVLPDIRGLQLAAHYQTSRQAGGDYYDFFPLADGRLGMLIADVSGHGTPAAVLMAITHTMAHSMPDPPLEPARMLGYLNENLSDAYLRTGSGFVTAFYGIYDPSSRTLHYASAGHNPPRVRRGDGGVVEAVELARDIPLGVMRETRYSEATATLNAHDTLVLYTDGITEARAHTSGALFGEKRLDDAIAHAPPDAPATIAQVLDDVEKFANGRPADDDRTLVVARAV